MAAGVTPSSLELTGLVIVGQAVDGLAWTGSLAEAPLSSIFVGLAATPDLVFGIGRIVGAVFETGGIASHGAIIARELGLPCIVKVAGCRDAVSRGFDRVQLDPLGQRAVFHRR